MSALRRIPPAVLGALLLVLVVVAVVVASGGGGSEDDDGAYRVRATFRNVFGISPDVDVRVAGAQVGSVEQVTLDDRGRPVLVLRIDDPAFRGFRSDARCSVLPQGVIGERFVECETTRPRTPGSPTPPLLRTVRVDGREQSVLPVSRTVRPIDMDLVTNMWQVPQRRRLAVILNELGAGLGARGQDLDDALRAALPGLRDTDEVLRILRGQTGDLRRLIADGRRSMEPFARGRERFVGFLRGISTLQEAIGERLPEVDENLRRLPETLRDVAPASRRLATASNRTARTLAELRTSADDITALLRGTRRIAETGTGPVRRLGSSTALARTALREAQPAVAELASVTAKARTPLALASDLLGSMRTTGGSRRALDYLFYQGLAFNGYDDAGHYLRVMQVSGPCGTYAVRPVQGCATGTFPGGTYEPNQAPARSAREALPKSASLADRLTAEIHDGATAAEALADAPRTAELRRLLADVAAARRDGAAIERGGGR